MTPGCFADILEPSQILTAADDLARYDQDGRQGGGHAVAVLRPRCVAQVAGVVRAAAAAGLRLVPQGGRSGLVGAGLADGDVVLSLERLNAAPVVDPDNRTVRAEAGVSLSAVNAAAARHGLFFPIDLGADPSVGGMIAANTGGAKLLRYGDVRRNVLGLQAVLSDDAGSVVELGKGLWKDNSGLDLKQLLIGGAGSIGVVTAATLALQPLPASRVTAMLALDHPAAAIEILARLESRLGALLVAFEGISGAAVAAALAHVPRLRSPFGALLPNYVVLVEVAAGSALSDELLEECLAAALADAMEGAGAPVSDVVLARDDSLWALRHAVPEGLRASGKVVACDVSLRRGDVMRCRARLIEKVRDTAPQLRLCDFGHVGDGGMHFNFVWPADAGPFDAAAAEAVRESVFTTVVEDFGGSFSAEHGIGPVNAGYYARFCDPRQRDLAGRVQRVIAARPVGRVDFGGETRQ